MIRMITYRPGPDELSYTFGGAPAVARIQPGDMLVVTTEDCFGGRVRNADDLPSRVCQFPCLNPVSGPFHVVGAAPGDTIALHVVSITPIRSWGVSATFPHFGALTSTRNTATLQQPLPERVWVYGVDADAGTVRYRARGSAYTVDLPLEPMLGTVGVAPAGGEVRSTIVPDVHGGNMDTPELRPGVTLYLPVNVDGGMFALGDGHARQGDGEVCGAGVEIATETTLVVDVLKGMSTPLPRLESADSLMSVGSARPLEDAYRISQHDLVTWIAELTGLETLDAYQLVSQAGTAPVGNVCDPNYTMVAAIDKRFLPAATVYRGIHDRLRAAALGTRASR